MCVCVLGLGWVKVHVAPDFNLMMVDLHEDEVVSDQ